MRFTVTPLTRTAKMSVAEYRENAPNFLLPPYCCVFSGTWRVVPYRFQAATGASLTTCLAGGLAMLGEPQGSHRPSSAHRAMAGRLALRKEWKSMTQPIGELNPPNRLMMTPGPCSIDPRVYRALASPIVGHLDPWFRGCMEETQILLRQIFQTENRITFPLSASGSGGIEAAVLNSLEPGDECICCVNGLFSGRMHVIAQHTPATIHLLDVPLGKPVDAEDVRHVAKGRKIKMIGFAQGETSTGVVTEIDPIRKVADECGALLVVDTVASLCAVPLDVDKQRIDICFSGSQKAISAPPGMSPITVSSRAEEVFRARKSKVQSWYFDLSTAMNYWGKDRLYHHTPPISLIYALREAMRICVEEGLEARWERHRVNQLALVAGLEGLGLKLFVENPQDRLVTVTAVNIPAGVNDEKFRNQLLDEFNIEIAGGIGPTKGQIWRLGTMGWCSQRAFILQLLAAMDKALLDQGHRHSPGAGVAGAIHSYTHVEKPVAAAR